jgi:hypothetical protein
MAENYMQLLSEGAKVTSDVFGRVDQAMTNNLKVRADAQQFAVGMTAKAAEFAEETRMNDANIQNMQADNYLRGQEFLLKQQLAPLQVEESILRLEAMKEQSVARAEANKFSMFNTITKAFEPAINNRILTTLNPEMAAEYAEYRGKYMAHVAQGGGFSGEDYQKGINKIMSKYQDVKPTDEPWNPRSRYLLSQINPELAAAYDLQNPVLKEHKTGLASSYLGMTPAQAGDFMGKYKTLYSNEEWGAIAPARDRYQANQNELEYIQKQATYLETKLATEDDEKKADIRSQIDALNNKGAELLRVNMALSQNHALGKYGMTSEPIVDDASATPGFEEPKYIDTNAWLKDQELVAGIPKSEDDRFIKDMRQKITDVSSIVLKGTSATDLEETELAGISLEWFARKGDGKTPDLMTRSKIKNNIEVNIERLGNLGEIFTEERIFDLLKKVPTPVEIPISNVLAEQLHAETKDIFGEIAPVATVGGTEKTWRDAIPGGKNAKSLLNTKDKVFEVIKTLPRLEREAAEREIYAVILTAGLLNVATE